jgi:putative ABC transport system permease protein
MDATAEGLGLATFGQELRCALRNLTRLPGLSAAVVLTLALAVAANAAVFSLVHGVLLSPLPYREAERIVALWMESPVMGDSRIRQSPATYLHFSKESRTFEHIALAEPQAVTLDDGVRPERLLAALVTAPLYAVLAVPPGPGRALTRHDSLPDAEPVVVLGDALWAARFGRDPSMLGRTLEIDGVRRRVVGILPPDLAFPTADTQLWLPLSFDPVAPPTLSFRYAGYGRLAAGVSDEAAARDLDRLIATLPDAYPKGFSRAIIEEAKIRARVRLLTEEVVGEVRPALWILLGAVLALLGITAANLANLFAMRAESRRRELAVRSALGAGRRELLASLLAEVVWLAATGTAAGLLLGVAALKSLKLFAPGGIPRLQQVELDWRVVAVTVGVSLAAALAAGTAPALEIGWSSLLAHLRAGSPGAGTAPGRLRLRDALVVVQVALALVLVASSGLLVRSYWALSRMDPGFHARDVLTLRVALPEPDYKEWSQTVAFFHAFVDRVRALPGVERAALASHLPLRDDHSLLPYEVEDEPRAEDEVRPMTLVKLVSEDYFATLGIPLLAGRTLERADAEEARTSVVIDRAFAERHWPGRSALGRRLHLGSGEAWLQVVGVVGAVRDRNLTEPPAPILYLPLAGPEDYYFARREMSLAVAADRPGALLGSIRQVLSQQDRGLPIYDSRTMGQVVADAAARTRFTASLLGIAALAALILGAVGLYGLLAYAVRRRQREIGIRMALGAHQGRVRSMVLGKALVLSCLGVVLGSAAALWLGRLLASQLFAIHPSDPLTLLAAAGLLLAVACVAGDIPARRAARLDPAGTLRREE